jgi:hypothetical protein
MCEYRQQTGGAEKRCRFRRFTLPQMARELGALRGAAAYGGAIGTVAALFKTFGPGREAGSGAANFVEIAAAALGFALLCSVAAILRNFIVRRFVSP